MVGTLREADRELVAQVAKKHGTDLIVLSACDTGTGEVKAGQGACSLRRAFNVAGAKWTVMSMWGVPDLESQELMVDSTGICLLAR